MEQFNLFLDTALKIIALIIFVFICLLYLRLVYLNNKISSINDDYRGRIRERKNNSIGSFGGVMEEDVEGLQKEWSEQTAPLIEAKEFIIELIPFLK